MPDIKGPGRLVSLCVDEAGEQTSGYASDTFLTGMAKIFLDLQVRAGDEIAIYRPSNIQLDLLMVRALTAIFNSMLSQAGMTQSLLIP